MDGVHLKDYDREGEKMNAEVFFDINLDFLVQDFYQKRPYST
jgi:hypothetical protein